MVEMLDKLSAIAIICLTIVTLGSIISLSIYQINDRVLMSKNIESAIQKGVDPLTVRCSYSKGDDPICISFTISKHDSVSTPSVTKK